MNQFFKILLVSRWFLQITSALAQNSLVTVKSKILRSDGKPLKLAHVHGLGNPLDYKFQESSEQANKDGSFQLGIDVHTSSMPIYFTCVTLSSSLEKTVNTYFNKI